MSHDLRELPELPFRRLERTPALLRTLIPLLLLVGGFAIVGAFIVDAPRAWRAYHFNWLYFTTIAQGAVTLAAAVTITRGLWSRPIRRIALGFVAFLPVAYLMVIPILALGARDIFPWVEHPVVKKAAYLNVPFMSARILGLLGILFVLDLVFVYWSLRPDLGRLEANLPENLKRLYARFTANWQGEEYEEVRAYRKLAVLSPILVLAWAVTFGVVAWDFVMSLEPHWFSTMIGPYFFMAGFLGGIAATAMALVFFVIRGGQADIIRPNNIHDIGKMTFGFCAFWAYLFYSQFIVIWYGLLPVEQDWLIHRLGPPFTKLTTTVVFMIFVLPFFGLLGVTPKRTPRILVVFTTIVLIGLWLERYFLVYPAYYAGREDLPLGWMEVGTGLAFLGIFLACLMWFWTRFPLYQMWQPMSEVELLGVETPQVVGEVVR